MVRLVPDGRGFPLRVGGFGGAGDATSATNRDLSGQIRDGEAARPRRGYRFGVQESHAHIPHPALRPYVESALGYRITGLAPGVHVGLPSMALTVVIPLDAPLQVQHAGDPAPAGYDTVVAGLHTSPVRIHHDGNQFGIQLALSPPGARLLLGHPSAALGPRSQDIGDVLGRGARETVARMRDCRTWPERFALLDTTLLRRVAGRTRSMPAETLHAWRLAVGDPDRSVAALAHEVGWSERTLQKRFRAEYGVTPGEVGRVRRFSRSAELVANPRLSLADAAARAGYADQAHMTRAWTRYAGLPPARWRTEDTLAFTTDAT